MEPHRDHQGGTSYLLCEQAWQSASGIRFIEMRKEMFSKAREGGRHLEMLFRVIWLMFLAHTLLNGLTGLLLLELSFCSDWFLSVSCSCSLATWQRFSVTRSFADLWLGPVQLLHQGLERPICQGPDSKYFRLCTIGLCRNYLTLAL